MENKPIADMFSEINFNGGPQPAPVAPSKPMNSL